MARAPVNQSVAEDTVRESLGLTADDLGMDRDSPFDDSDDDGLDIGNDDQDEGYTGSRRGRDLDDESDDETGQQQHEPQQRHQTEDNDPLFAPQPQQNQPDPNARLPASAEIRFDQKGNIVDKKTGQIVAKAGNEARLYKKAHKATQELGRVQTQSQDVTNRLNKAVEIGTQLFDRLKEANIRMENLAPTKYGLNDQQAIEALNMAKQAATDPVGVLKTLLTRAAAQGIDLTQIGLAGGNFDPKAFMELVRTEIGTQMKPLNERTQRETQTEQQQREAAQRDTDAKNELTTFLGQNPEAKQYLHVFQQVYSQPQFQNMPLGEVWAKLQLNLMRRGNQPQRDQRPNNRNRNRQPLPRGNGQPPRSAPTDIAPVDMSYEDIVRGLLPGR